MTPFKDLPDKSSKIMWTSKIDTSCTGMHFGTLFDKVWISCSLRDCHILYIQLGSQLLTLSIDMFNDEIGQHISVETCHT